MQLEQGAIMDKIDLIIAALRKVEFLFEAHGQYPHTLREVNEALAAANELRKLKPVAWSNPQRISQTNKGDKMSKHTAAPWTATASTPEDGFECFFIYAGEGYSQRQVATVDGPQNEKGEANAKLIAAAPELLEALKCLTDQIFDQEIMISWDDKQKALAAIAKAEVEK
jgi:hypothetical protein